MSADGTPATVGGPRPAHGLWTVLTASDPGLLRLRTAATTIGVLAVTLGILVGLTSATGEPVTVAMLGVVVAMISSIAVSDPGPRQQAVTVALMTVTAAAAVTLGALLAAHRFVGEAVFVGVVVVAVLLRRIGPRGFAVGMIAFIGYFFALFLHATTGQLPALLVALAVGAVLSMGVRLLLRPRRPDRDLQRMLTALQVRSGGAVAALADALAAGELHGRALTRLRRRLGSSGEAALMVEQQLEGEEEIGLDGRPDDELSVRVFDAQLAVERLVSVGGAVLREGPRAVPEPLLRRLRGLAQVLSDATGRPPTEQARALAHLRAPSDGARAADPGDRVAQLAAAADRGVDAWERVLGAPDRDEDRAEPPAPAAHHADDQDEQHDGGDQHDRGDDGGGSGAGSGAPWRSSLQQALQVGLASAASIVVGELISPTRWFWATIAAFVVFTGTSTRGQILSKGWQRILGTLGGVLAGVLVAAAVGGATYPSLALIFVCLFLGFYLMRISSAAMVFFITTMLALLYGLLGMFSVGLLLLRLEETAVGAGIGVLVSFFVFPSSTRAAARDGVRGFLDELDGLLERVTTDLTDRSTGPEGSAPEASRGLRTSYDDLRTTARPLTHGLSGLGNRAGFRHLLAVLGVCEHHARALARTADLHRGVAAAGSLHRAVTVAVAGVRADVAALRGAFEPGHDGAPADPGRAAVPEPAAVPDRTGDRPAGDAVDELEHCADSLAGADQRAVLALARHLRAIDGAVRALATDLGAPAADRDEHGVAA